MKRNKSIALILLVTSIICRSGFGFEKGTFTDARDKREYRTIKIGTQEWFAENFAYLPHVSPMGSGDGIWVGGYSGRDVAEAKKMPQYLLLGPLYSWSKAKELCPEDWRLPTDKDWEALIETLGGPEAASAKLKPLGVDEWSPFDISEEELSGFDAPPGGYIVIDEDPFWDGAEEAAQYWATDLKGRVVIRYNIPARSRKVFAQTDQRQGLYGCSVRYVRNLSGSKEAVEPSSDPWLMDFEEAKKVAGREGKSIYILFIGQTGRAFSPSEHRDMLALMENKEFSNEARKHFVLCGLDCKRYFENELLAKDYAPSVLGVVRYPCAGIVDAKGNSIYKPEDDFFNVKTLVEAVEKVTGGKKQKTSSQTDNSSGNAWFTETDFDKATALAQEESKPFLCLFYKDLECKVSIRGQQQALRIAMQNPQFITEARKHFVLMTMDCAKNEGALESEAQAYGVTKDGSEVIYPCMGVIDTHGNSCYKSATDLFNVETILKEMKAPDTSKQEEQKPKAEPTDSLDDNVWLTSIEAAEEKAAKTGHQEILVVFTNPSESELCAMAERCVFNNKNEFLKYAVRFVLVKFDVPTIKKAQAEGNSAYRQVIIDFDLLTPDNKIKEFRVPHIWLLDQQGRPCGEYVFSDHHDHPGLFITQIENLRKSKTKRDQLLEKAALANGPERAKLLDEALTIVGDSNVTRRAYRDMMNQIIELDPDNPAGAGNKYRKILLSERIKELTQQQKWESLLSVIEEYFNCNPSDAEAQESYWSRLIALLQLQRNKDALTAADDYLQRYEPKERFNKNPNDAARALQVYGTKIPLLTQERQWDQIVSAADHCLDVYHFNIDDATRQQLKFAKANALFEMNQLIAARELLSLASIWEESGLNKEAVPRLKQKIDQARIAKIIKTQFAGQTPEYPKMNNVTITPDSFKSLSSEEQTNVLAGLSDEHLRDIYMLSLSDSQKEELYYSVRAGIGKLPKLGSPEEAKRVLSKYQRLLLILQVESQDWDFEPHKYVYILVPPHWSVQKYSDDSFLGIFLLESPEVSEYNPYEADISVSQLAGANLTVRQFEDNYQNILIESRDRVLEKSLLAIKTLSAIGYKIHTQYPNMEFYSYQVYILGKEYMIKVHCVTKSEEALNYYMPLFEHFISTIEIQ